MALRLASLDGPSTESIENMYPPMLYQMTLRAYARVRTGNHHCRELSQFCWFWLVEATFLVSKCCSSCLVFSVSIVSDFDFFGENDVGKKENSGHRAAQE